MRAAVFLVLVGISGLSWLLRMWSNNDIHYLMTETKKKEAGWRRPRMIRWSQGEWDTIGEVARERGMTISDLVRAAVVRDVPRMKADGERGER